MKTQRLCLDRISTLPDSIIENILTLVPIRDALRTSILARKWRYSWRNMPTVVFTNRMVKVPSRGGSTQLRKYKIVNAIFHVLLLHNGPTVVKFFWSFHELEMSSEFDQIISHLSKRDNVKEVTFTISDGRYNLPVSFFSLKGLEYIYLHNCGFEHPLSFNGFDRLRSVTFINVEFSARMLQEFLSNCPLLDELHLAGFVQDIKLAAGGTKFTFVDLLQCVPLIKTLNVVHYYAKYLCAGDMPHRLPTPLVHLKYLYLDVCLMEQNEISSALCMIRSSPMLEKIMIAMYDNEEEPVQQTSANFLDLEHYSDLKLDHLETLEIRNFSSLPLDMEFVKLIMAKSPMLKKVELLLDVDLSVDEEVNMLRDLVLFPFPKASPAAKLIIKRPETT